jgi:hypothetical protein
VTGGIVAKLNVGERALAVCVHVDSAASKGSAITNEPCPTDDGLSTARDEDRATVSRTDAAIINCRIADKVAAFDRHVAADDS